MSPRPKNPIKFKKQTYYLEDKTIGALSLYCIYERKDKSETVRQALKGLIPEKYFVMAEEMVEDES